MEKKLSVEQKIDRLAVVVERGFAAIASDIQEIRETVATKADISDFATKDEVRSIVRTEIDAALIPIKLDLQYIKDDVRDIRNRIEKLEESTKNHSGFAKEIDHLFDRIATIEKHLGIKIKAVA